MLKISNNSSYEAMPPNKALQLTALSALRAARAEPELGR